MPLPSEVLHKIDDLMRGDLQALRDGYFDWLLYSTYLVIIGVVLEGPEVVHEAIDLFRKSDTASKTPNWIKFVALVGWLFVVLGVAGEAYFDAKVSNGDTQLQAFNTSLLVEAQRESADAERHATNSILFAGEASESAKKAADSSQQAEQLASGARREADLFEKEIELAESKLAYLQERVRIRHLSAEQRKKLSDFLNAAATTNAPRGPFRIQRLLLDETAQPFAVEIKDAFTAGGWPSDDVGRDIIPSGGSIPVGVVVIFHSSQSIPAHAGVIQGALTAAGLDPTLGENPNVPEGMVEIMIGVKP